MDLSAPMQGIIAPLALQSRHQARCTCQAQAVNVRMTLGHPPYATVNDPDSLVATTAASIVLVSHRLLQQYDRLS